MEGQFTAGGVSLESAMGFWIQRVFAAMRTALYDTFREDGIEMTPEQWMVLARLWERDGVNQNALCESTLKDKPTMSRILDGMERRRWIVRRSDPLDGRARVVSLTPKGRALRDQLIPKVRALVARLESGISEKDLLQTRRTLQRMFGNLTGEARTP
jgi:DNA-binding MarR family transcriptional regulator